MSSASPGASDRKHTRRAGRKASTLRPDTNTSVTTAVRVVMIHLYADSPYRLRCSCLVNLAGHVKYDQKVQVER